jgi:hypothetical protein
LDGLWCWSQVTPSGHSRTPRMIRILPCRHSCADLAMVLGVDCSDQFYWLPGLKVIETRNSRLRITSDGTWLEKLLAICLDHSWSWLRVQRNSLEVFSSTSPSFKRSFGRFTPASSAQPWTSSLST